MKTLPSAYDPRDHEPQIYKKWEKSGYFNPDNLPEKLIRKDKNDKELTYTIVLPPPNITDKLHLGHVAMLAIEDLLIRYHRMKGCRALWIPGTDHAAIATQNVVEKKLLKEEGITRHDLGREKFLDEIWKFLRETQSTILHQIKKTGASLNWSREAFTLDKQREKAVRRMFVDMYKAGVIYRGERIVNWCPRCHSTLADDEVEYKEQKTKLYTFKYSKDFPFTIATTRPETKLGDTAVAVNLKDKRYKKYIGKIYEVDFVGTKLKLKIIADRNVEMDFGTGALGVTPAHSMADWQMAEKNDLGIIKVIGEDGKIKDNFGKYSNRSVTEAREMIIEKLRENNLLEKEEEIKNNLSFCYRCGTAIEPLPSKQWFVSVDKKIKKLGNKSLREKAIEVVQQGKIEFIPERFKKRYLDWMENLHDWCISRQIWFGHRIPVWYCFDCNKGKIKEDSFILIDEDNRKSSIVMHGNEDGEFHPSFEHLKRLLDEGEGLTADNFKPIILSGNDECKCPDCGSKNLFQDPDTLDTWFSSGMWTFSTLGWPDNFKNNKKSGDLAKFHPTQTLETGYEILTLWVSRMVMMSLFALNEIPFEKVYLHGMVLDEYGKKMSKSKGNGIDPIDVIDKFGTDAVRLSLLIGSTPGNDVRIGEEKIEGHRNLVNKLWNISRYILQNQGSRTKHQEINYKDLTFADKWILGELNNTIKKVTDDLENYNFSTAGEKLREFTWNDFADWYIEVSKIEKDKDEILVYILKQLLILWHPFIPFVTEEIWKNLDAKNLLIIEKWPQERNYKKSLNQTEEYTFIKVQSIVTAIRNARAKYKIEPSKKIQAIIYAGTDYEIIKDEGVLIKGLRTGIGKLEIKEKGAKIKDVVYSVVGNIEIYLTGMIDIEKEKARNKKELKKLEKYAGELEKKLQNKKFIAKAPKEIIKNEKTKLKDQKLKINKIRTFLSSLE